MLCRWHEAKRKMERDPAADELEVLQQLCDECPKPCAAQSDRTIITYNLEFDLSYIKRAQHPDTKGARDVSP